MVQNLSKGELANDLNIDYNPMGIQFFVYEEQWQNTINVGEFWSSIFFH